MEFENAALALIDDDEKEAVHRLFDKLCDLYDALFEKYKSIMMLTVSIFTMTGDPSELLSSP